MKPYKTNQMIAVFNQPVTTVHGPSDSQRFFGSRNEALMTDF